MGRLKLWFLVVGLSACSPPTQADQPKAPVVAAAITFDGADGDRAALMAHGERLSHVLGCRGCHTANLQGRWFNDDAPDMGKLYATNLTRVLPQYSDAQLEALLRTGKHPVRGDLWIMPSEVFQRLSDADMKALIAHLRTVKPAGEATPPPAMSDKAKVMIAKGDLKPVAFYVAKYRAEQPVDLGETHALGRYVAGATCAECHGADLTGIPDFGPGVNTPDLDIVGTYSDAELARLLTTGEGKTKKDLGLMTLVGKGHFSFLTPHEREAVVAYLKARAARAK